MNTELNNRAELADLIENEQAVLAYFYSNNCAPCVSLRPKVEELIKNSFPKLKLVFVNSEKHPEITGSYGVFSNPTLIVFLEAREYRRGSKYISITQLEQEINRPYQLLFN